MKYLKSRTINFSILLAVMGVVEMNLHLIQDHLGDDYGAVYIIIASIVAALRVITTQDIEDK